VVHENVSELKKKMLRYFLKFVKLKKQIHMNICIKNIYFKKPEIFE